MRVCWHVLMSQVMSQQWAERTLTIKNELRFELLDCWPTSHLHSQESLGLQTLSTTILSALLAIS